MHLDIFRICWALGLANLGLAKSVSDNYTKQINNLGRFRTNGLFFEAPELSFSDQHRDENQVPAYLKNYQNQAEAQNGPGPENYFDTLQNQLDPWEKFETPNSEWLVNDDSPTKYKVNSKSVVHHKNPKVSYLARRSKDENKPKFNLDLWKKLILAWNPYKWERS